MRLLQDERRWGEAETVLALGMFDGVHRGHARLLETARHAARARGAQCVAFTFSHHPLAVLRPQDAPLLLTLPGEKATEMARLGLDALVMRRFDAAFGALPAEVFVAHLAATLRPREVIVGFNYHFGAHGQGDSQLLRTLGARYGFTTRVLPPVCWRGQPVSSTRAREAVLAAREEEARLLLGRPYSFCGVVRPGKRIGRAIGYPTANLIPPRGKALPPYGVYAVWALVEGQRFPAIMNLGIHPTVPDGPPTIEVHLLDACRALYGRRITVELTAHLRPEVRFDTLDDLRAQIALDIATVRDALRL